jgi:hypothetical protein
VDVNGKETRTMKTSAPVLGFLACCLLAAPFAADAQVTLTEGAAEQAGPRYTTLDIFDSPLVEHPSINDRRMVTGAFFRFNPEGEEGGLNIGFALQDRFLVQIEPLGNRNNVFVLGNNDRGELVGRFLDGAFLYSRGEFTTISVPDSGSTTPRDINNRGDIVGLTELTGHRSHGFLLSGDQLTLIDGPESPFFDVNVFGLNDRREVVGCYGTRNTPGASHLGFVFRKGAYTTLRAPGAQVTCATAINNYGQIVGSYLHAGSTPGDHHHGFVLWKGRYVTIDIPNSTLTLITSINDFGDIVGTYREPSFVSHAFRSNIREFLPPRRRPR